MNYPRGLNHDRKCEDCKYYHIIDSGYGWCVRFPPRFRFWVKGFKFYGADMYPEVPWDCRSCGEFREM